MMKAVKWGAVLIGGYLVLNHYTGFGKSVSAATSGAATVVKAFQGR